VNKVLQLTAQQLPSVRGSLQAAGFATAATLPAGAIFLLRGHDCVVTAYRSGKILIQGTGALEAEALVRQAIGHESAQNEGEVLFPVVGGDESGKGDLFGPLVVAAFAAGTAIDRQAVVEAGARDCKLMSDEEVLRVAKRVAQIGRSAVRVLMPDEYNAAYARSRNVNILLNGLYARLLADLAAEVKAQTVILDKYGPRALTLWEDVRPFRFIVETHAERYPEVAAASVLARAAFLHGLGKVGFENGYGILPKGSSRDTQSYMRKVAHERGEQGLRMVAKMNFAPIRDCLHDLFP
jgi:ribonuclease HIII